MDHVPDDQDHEIAAEDQGQEIVVLIDAGEVDRTQEKEEDVQETDGDLDLRDVVEKMSLGVVRERDLPHRHLHPAQDRHQQKRRTPLRLQDLQRRRRLKNKQMQQRKNLKMKTMTRVVMLIRMSIKQKMENLMIKRERAKKK